MRVFTDEPRMVVGLVLALILLLTTGGDSVGIANAAPPMSVGGSYEAKSSILLSNRTTADGMLYRTLAVRTEITGGLEGVQEYLVFQEINTKTNKATSTGLGTFTGRVKGIGTGQAVFSFVSTIEGFNTTQHKLQGKFWHDRGRSGLEGYRLEGTFQGTTQSGGTYEAQASYGQEVVETVSPLTYLGIAAGIVIAVAGIVVGRRRRKQK